jgi:hypothetical protein
VEGLDDKLKRLREELKVAAAEKRFEDEKGRILAEGQIYREYKFILVNEELQKIDRSKLNPRYHFMTDKRGLVYIVDDYGQGAVHWPAIKAKEEEADRRHIENVLWAAERLIWARDNAKKECEKLFKVILTGER